MDKILLNGVEIPSFVIVSKIRRPVHPPFVRNLIKVPGMDGAIPSSTEMSEYRIYVDYGLSFTSKEEMEAKLAELAEWLYYEEEVPLVLPDSDKYEMVQVDGETSWDSLRRTGTGTITFLVADPTRYGAEKRIPFAPSTTDPVQITNEGQCETFPIIECTFTQNTSEFSIISDSAFLYFGEPAPVDLVTPVPKRTQIFHDNCSSVAGWTAGVGVDGGSIEGRLESTGGTIRQQNGDFGTGPTWHGAAGVKVLSKELQDFTLETHVGFKSVYPYQIARLELYLLDINNNRIGKMAMRDSTSGVNSPFLEARAGALSGGTLFVNEEVGKGYWANFYGKLTIQRIGNQWVFEIGKKDESGNYWGRWHKHYYDQHHQYQTKVKGIQIHLGAYGTYPPYSTFYFENITVWEENTIDPVTQVPYVFHPGDRLVINNETGEIKKNGVDFYEALSPDSDYIRFKPGVNSLSVSPAIVTNGQIRFRERWLR